MMNKDMLLHQHHHQPQQDENMSNLTSASGDQASVSSGNITEASGSNYFPHHQQQQQQEQFCLPDSQPQKKRRNQPGNPDPESEVIALSPKTLMATNRFVCEICSKGFQRDQNLQLHRRGHNLPWKLKQRSNKEVIRKKVYVCPEATCVHHDPSRALGDLTGIKKHFCRKHGEKKWKCDKCSKKYAVQSDCKAHSKTCGTKEYRCDCGTLFSRRDSFITHRAFCEALAEETAREVVLPQNQNNQQNPLLIHQSSSYPHQHQTQPNVNVSSSSSSSHNIINSLHFEHANNGTSHGNSSSNHLHTFSMKKEQQNNDHNISYHHSIPPWLAPHPRDLTSSNPNPSNGGGGGLFSLASPAMSATALLQKAAQMGSTKTPPLPPTTGFERSTHNKNLTTTMAPMMTSPSAFNNNNSQVMFQDYNASGFDNQGGEEAFDEAFGGFLRTNEATATRSDKSKSGGGEGLTRDFLGLRPLMSHNEILSFAGLGNCINTSASEQLHPKPWQGKRGGYALDSI
ncbi:protein indeterminate-domain 11 isoform X1 [Capsella rubella]|uniref:protein indeterminate-domain 11 isoform X1 n=1 Tax=Capsella rubella TaxID=81985 RepID=UPI000CD5313F|nr:protein indeterminate-domain 11 isoform X1 [Capsella rubella]XP_023642312.1 protein indeterminate-domain 11 isoform X1 [Capsella rubella]XP_023642313.1 protein indeterminate-domain 11 isoform X1 [Capsella rubella]